jgi:hypothetical protein
MSYRVLRLLEYTYPDAKAADNDMRHWGIPPIGAAGKGTTVIRSTIMQMPGEDDDE